MADVAEAGEPGTFLVDIFPIRKLSNVYFSSAHSFPVRHVPEWVPGAGFKKKARIWREQVVELAETPFGNIKQAMVSIYDTCC